MSDSGSLKERLRDVAQTIGFGAFGVAPFPNPAGQRHGLRRKRFSQLSALYPKSSACFPRRTAHRIAGAVGDQNRGDAVFVEAQRLYADTIAQQYVMDHLPVIAELLQQRQIVKTAAAARLRDDDHRRKGPTLHFPNSMMFSEPDDDFRRGTRCSRLAVDAVA